MNFCARFENFRDFDFFPKKYHSVEEIVNPIIEKNTTIQKGRKPVPERKPSDKTTPSPPIVDPIKVVKMGFVVKMFKT